MLKQQLTSAIQKNADLKAFLQSFVARSFKTGELPKRATFANVPTPVIADLRAIFGAPAVKVRDEKVQLNLAAAGLSEAEARRNLLQILAEALSLPTENRRARRQRLFDFLNRKLHELLNHRELDLTRNIILTLSEDLVKQRGWVWRIGVIKGKVDEVLLQIEYVLKALEFVSQSGRELTFSELGSRVTGSSKSFRSGSTLYRLAADAAVRFLDDAESLREIDDVAARRKRVWEHLGVAESTAGIAVMVAGPLVYHKHGQVFTDVQQHFQLGEASTITLQQLMAIDHIEPSFDAVLTVENLTPFVELIRKPAIPRCLMIYTEGFPNRAVHKLLQLCHEKTNGLKFFHWGDTDLAGVRILRMLTGTLGESPQPFRCGAEDIARHKERLISLSPEQRRRIEQDFQAHPEADGHEILAAVLEHNGWLEQEAWEE